MKEITITYNCGDCTSYIKDVTHANYFVEKNTIVVYKNDGTFVIIKHVDYVQGKCRVVVV